jgi:chromosome segregation ATPase
MSRGIGIGSAAMSVLHDNAGGMNIEQAAERLSHISGSKAELMEAIAYLALQANTYRRMSNQDAHLALVQITQIAAEYNLRRHA